MSYFAFGLQNIVFGIEFLHLIFYRVLKNEKVKIIRILHERMDFGRHL